MTSREFATAIQWMGDSDEITITVRAGALRNAMEMACGGPEIMSTAQAAKVFGWSPRRWRDWAKAELVRGAWQEDNGDWRLPREACRELVDQMRESGRRPERRDRREGAPIPLQATPTRAQKPATMNPSKRSIRRGPRQVANR